MPRTKYQLYVERESARLPSISTAAIKWLFGQISNYAFVSPVRHKANCLECGGVLSEEDVKMRYCPHCGKRLEIVTTKGNHATALDYGLIITTYKGNQLLRLFVCRKYMYKGKPVTLSYDEVGQVWLNGEGKVAVMRHSRSPFSHYNLDRWEFWDKMHITRYYNGDGFDELIRRYSTTYPHQRFIPELKRNGLDKYGLHIQKRQCGIVGLMRGLLSDYRIESLYKHRQYEVVARAINYPEDVWKRWPQLKIAMRHNFIVNEWYMWNDTIKMLEHFGKDVRNPYYICSKDIKGLHDKLVRKGEEEKRREERARLAEKEAAYRKMRGALMGICIVSGNIAIHTLDSVTEVYDEGEAMHHCVYHAGYYNKKGSLLLSATIDGKRVETIEYDIKTNKVLQSRGHCNSCTDYHDAIIGLVESKLAKACRIAKKA